MSNYPRFNFRIDATDPYSRARVGFLTTPHGSLETPAFIFCATRAAMKAATPADLLASGTQIILSNTYHLMLQPGSELIARQGGLHKFCGWNGPMLTDSGGFQIFSLGHGSVADEIKGRRTQNRVQTLLKITEHGAEFRSYLDGRLHVLTPERSIQIQRELGADLIVVLDECTPFHADKAYTARSLALSHRWGLRCLQEFNRGLDQGDERQALYGILQGGIYPDLRQEAAEFVNNQPFFGHAVGGTLGGDKQQMQEVVEVAMRHLRPDRPVHLLGIGGISDIISGVAQGIDTFDCVAPTRMARHGAALLPKTPNERINLNNACHREDRNPLWDDCTCYCCRNFSRAYLHHLFKSHEILGMQLITIHNIAVMNRLMHDVRHAIRLGKLTDVKNQWLV